MHLVTLVAWLSTLRASAGTSVTIMIGTESW